MSLMVLRNFFRIFISILESTRSARDLWIWISIDGTKMLSTGSIDFSNYDTSNIPNLSNPTVNLSLASPKKCDNMFSDTHPDHLFSYFLGTYLVYIMFLLVCDHLPLTSKRLRCRNTLSIDSWLNWIDLSKNIISPPNAEQGYRSKFKILLGGVFQYSIE